MTNLKFFGKPIHKRVDKSAIHPYFDKSVSAKNDIALLYLDSKITLLKHLFQKFSSCFYTQKIGSATQNSILKSLELDPVEKQIHSRLLTAVGTEEGYCEWNEDTICAKTKELDINCGNDFGGPVIHYQNKNLVGIIPYKSENCSEEHAEEFVRVEKHVGWIDQEYRKFWCLTAFGGLFKSFLC